MDGLFKIDLQLNKKYIFFTEFIEFGNPYGGIPQNLLINVLGWLFLVLLFGILRRVAGNYGRLAILRREDDESRYRFVFVPRCTQILV